MFNGMLIIWLIVIIGVQQLVAFMTVAERKLMGAMQRRVGPNIVGYRGILQPIADGIKQLLKETIQPLESNPAIFLGAPQILFYLSLMNWMVIPLDHGVAISRISNSVQYVMAISELGVYGVIFSGWSANSKYPQIGSMRSTAQMISYSVSLSLQIQTIVIVIGTVDLQDIQAFQTGLPIGLALPLFPLVIQFFLSLLAETNRAPFDLPEAESEQVAGFMTEHSAVAFVYFFLGEYTSIITLSTQQVIFFFGGQHVIINSIQVTFTQFQVIWVRSTLPRVRQDHLFQLGWGNILPFAIAFSIFIPCLMLTFDILG